MLSCKAKEIITLCYETLFSNGSHEASLVAVSACTLIQLKFRLWSKIMVCWSARECSCIWKHPLFMYIPTPCNGLLRHPKNVTWRNEMSILYFIIQSTLYLPTIPKYIISCGQSRIMIIGMSWSSHYLLDSAYSNTEFSLFLRFRGHSHFLCSKLIYSIIPKSLCTRHTFIRFSFSISLST
jgi:hypothetical protein